MRPRERATAHSGPARHRRLVSARPIRCSMHNRISAIMRSETWEALGNGLRAAEILRCRFPAFSTAHITTRATTPAQLLGVAQALFSLVEGLGVELPDVLDIRTDPEAPERALDQLPSFVRDDDDAVSALESSRWMLDTLHPVVYGQSHEVEPLFDGGDQNLLALMLWVLTDRTSWSLASDDIQEVVAYVIGELQPPREAFEQRLERLRDHAWPPDLPMDELCTRLDRQTYRGANLGAAVRFVFSMTGLQFADLSMEELDEMGGTGLDWFTVDFDHVAQCQAEARQVVQHYYDLDNLVSSDPAAFDDILTLLHRTVKATLRARRRRERRKAQAQVARGGGS